MRGIAFLSMMVLAAFGGCTRGKAPHDAGMQNDAAEDAGSKTDDGDPGFWDADSGGPDTEMNDAGVDGDGDSGAQPVAVCRWSCETPADCSGGTPGPYDEDNYACEGGVCRWLGCLSDEDCQAQLGMEDYLCREDVQGYVGPSCFKSCLLAEDCALSVPAHDQDNWACTDGICEYLGCNNDAECRITPDFAHYVCTGQFTLVPMCMPSCFTPEDCDMGAPAYDADNYDCTDGICVYAGCHSDEECNLGDSVHDLVCRE